MKQTFLFLLTLVLLCTLSVRAFAAETKTTSLSYTAASSYTVTIPASVTLSASSMTTNVSIAANPVIPAGQKITVTITNATNYSSGFRMLCGSNYIAYTIANGSTAVGKDTAFLSQNAGATSAAAAALTFTPGTITYAGTYADTLTFTINVINQ